MKISEIMTPQVISIDFEQSIAVLEKTLSDAKISGVPVSGPDGELIGLVSKSDLVRFSPSIADASKAKVWQIMTCDVCGVNADDDVVDVARKMIEKNVHRVVVYSGSEAVGLATTFDMLKVIVRSRT